MILANGDTANIESGNGDTVSLSSGTINISSGVNSINLSGSNNAVGPTSATTINVWGSGNSLNMVNGSYVGLQAGDSDDVTLNSGTVVMASNVTNAVLSGSSDQINGNLNDQISVYGTSDNILMSTGGYVGLLGGANDIVTMNSGSLNAMGGVTGVTLNGSNDTVSAGSGDQIVINGNNDIINVNSGGTITLSAGDSGDTINMTGGSVFLGSNLSNITINGVGDLLTGPDSSSSFVGTATVGLTIAVSGPYLGNETIVVTQAYTPPVVYDGGDIPLLVSYFEANPYLSENQIQAAESAPDYQSNLDAYLSTANLYGSSNSLPSNILAMLDGYSAVYLALTGVPASDLSKASYIEQQFNWATSNFPIPTDYLNADLQNLMPAIESTNTFTQGLVQEAIGLLQLGFAGAVSGNQTPMLDDSEAELLLAVAENPSFSQSAILGDEVYTGRPGGGHWQIEVQGNGTVIPAVYESPPLIETVLNDFDTYVAPIIDIAAVLCLNPEFIALTALPSAVATGVEVADTAVNLVQAGQNFAAGDDLQGVLGVAEAIGGALQDIGQAQGLSIGACSTTNGLQQFGEALSEGSQVAQGIDGVVSAVQSDNIFSAIVSGLGGASGIAGLAGDSQIQQYAAVGAELGSTALAAQSGDILAALDELVQATASANVLSNIVKDVDYLVAGFETGLTNLYNSVVVNNIPSASAGVPPGHGSGWITIVSLRNSPGFEMFGPDNTNEPSNSSIASDVANLPATPGVYVVGAHGQPLDVEGFDGTLLDPEELASVIKQDPNYQPGETVQLYACNTGADPTTLQLLDPTATAGIPNFAETLSFYLNNATVIAPTNYLWFTPNNENPTIAPAVNSQGQSVEWKPNVGDSEGTPVQNGWQSFNSHGPI